MHRDEYDICMAISAEAFTTSNPLIKHLGIPKDKWRRLTAAETPVEQAVDTGLSLVARGADGRPRAFLFMRVFDLRQRVPAAVLAEHPGMAIVAECIEGLYARSLAPNLLGLGSMVAGRTLHVDSGGTFPGAQGKGLGKALREAAVRHARERGFNRMIVEPGHPATVHIWTNRLGFRSVASLDASSWRRRDGSRPFEGCEHKVLLCELTLQRSFRDHMLLYPWNFSRVLLQTVLGRYSAPSVAILLALVVGILRRRK